MTEKYDGMDEDHAANVARYEECRKQADEDQVAHRVTQLKYEYDSLLIVAQAQIDIFELMAKGIREAMEPQLKRITVAM